MIYALYFQHAGQVDVVFKGDAASITCVWEDCGFETSDQREMVRHIYYHAYHTKIKCLGANLIEKLALPGCTLDPQSRNTVPELETALVCHWDDCSVEFVNVQEFYWHVHTHSMSVQITQTEDKKNQMKCLWENCKSSFSSKVFCFQIN